MAAVNNAVDIPSILKGLQSSTYVFLHQLFHCLSLQFSVFFTLARSSADMLFLRCLAAAELRAFPRPRFASDSSQRAFPVSLISILPLSWSRTTMRAQMCSLRDTGPLNNATSVSLGLSAYPGSVR